MNLRQLETLVRFSSPLPENIFRFAAEAVEASAHEDPLEAAMRAYGGEAQLVRRFPQQLALSKARRVGLQID